LTSLVISCLNGLADRFADKAKDKRAPDESELDYYHSHAFNVAEMLDRIDKKEPGGTEEYASLILHLALKLEVQSRALLMETLPAGSKAQLLLRADQQIQRRAQGKLEEKVMHNHPTPAEKAAYDLVRDLDKREKGEADEAHEAHEKEKASWYPPTEEMYQQQDYLHQIGAYRMTHAALLAAGSKLLKLEGEERYYFERRLEGNERLDHGGILLGVGRKGPAEKAMGVE
jgi:hypothetical protein